MDLSAERETEILRACLAGDWSGYGTLVDRYRRLAWAAVDAVLDDPEAVPDVVQEVFIRAYEKLHTFRFNSRFSTWLYRIARNHAMNFRRRALRLPAVSLDWEAGLRAKLAGGEQPERAYFVRERRRALGRMVAALPARYRAVVNLYYLGELTYEEIAEVLRTPLNTVRTHLRRARLQLARQAIECGWQEG